MEPIPQRLLTQLRDQIKGRSGPAFWRSMEEAVGKKSFQERLEAEFPQGASLWQGGQAGRREFLRLMGASLALAGMTGCVRPNRKIAPHVRQPEYAIPGDAVYYATAMPWCAHGRGVIVKTHEGRPIKIEGNPDHPDSLGSTDAITQAAILELYLPDRLRSPRRNKVSSSWRSFDRELLEVIQKAETQQGQGLALLVEPCTSPTWLRQLWELAERFPRLRIFSYSSFYTQIELAAVSPIYDFTRADVIISLGADLLDGRPGSIRYSRDFFNRRRDGLRLANPSRLYCAESDYSLTGGMADLRLAANPREILDLGRALTSGQNMQFRSETQRWLTSVRRELQTGRQVLLVVGSDLPIELHQAAAVFNEQWARDGVRYIQNPLCGPTDAEEVGGLVSAVDTGEIEALLIFSDNPTYTAPADVPLAKALDRIPWTAHLTHFWNETSAHCRWVIPQAHFLETWGDIRAFDGAATIQQPLIAPLYNGRSRYEILAYLTGPQRADPMQIVQQTWQENYKGNNFSAFWTQSLHDGIVREGVDYTENARRFETALNRQTSASSLNGEGSLFAIFRPDPMIGDGRWARNPWLQELPKPMNMLVWENAALLAPGIASERGLENGDVVRLELDGRSVEAPVWIQPGQDPACVVLHLGHGQAGAGGFNAGLLRSSKNPWITRGLAVHSTGKRHRLVTTQEHHSMHDRHLAIEGNYQELQANPQFVKSLMHTPAEEDSLYPIYRRGTYAWAMVIDLGACTGCRACVIACQAENNIPVVGKHQVGMGREMHWLRVDRYYIGEPAAPRVIHQPVPCMHCEKAPCEVVCPVAATTHSNGGVNEMTYNRCVGTRYCSNNCPYKVRRFNFLDYGRKSAPEALQHNPHVTVRMTGVMEKCTYCIQRINDARVNAKKQKRRIRDGEIMTACQQACPTEAIHFGDLNSPQSIVSQRRNSPLNYALLAELNTRPRTTYLARIHNTPESDTGGDT